MFINKDFPILYALLDQIVKRDCSRAFLTIIKIFDRMLKHPNLFDATKARYHKHTAIRLTIFLCLYYDNSRLFTLADNQNSFDRPDTKMTTIFNLFVHFKDEFPAISSPPYKAFKALLDKHPDSTANYLKIYLNKFASLHFSRNKILSASYFKILFDLGIRYRILDKDDISLCIWTTVINHKEYMFDALNDEGHVYDLPEDEKSDTRFIKELLKMKGKTPYDYMSYCNPHYHRFCLLLIMQ